jgi:hypothetical protein
MSAAPKAIKRYLAYVNLTDALFARVAEKACMRCSTDKHFYVVVTDSHVVDALEIVIDGRQKPYDRQRRKSPRIAVPLIS